MDDSRREHLLVGVDGTPESRLALAWAVAEAEARQLDLRILRVHPGRADRPPIAAGPSPEPYVADVGDATLTSARQDLDAAIEYVQDRLGPSRVDGDLLIGRPAGVLLEAAADAAALVIGSHHRSKSGAALLGSVANAVTSHAPSPVVVVRGAGWQSARNPVLVGVDGSAAGDAALAYSFEQAAQRGTELVAAHSWRPLGDISPDRWSPALLAETRQRHLDWMAEAVAAYREKYTGVPVRLVVVEGSPAAELTRLSEQADLVVVGSRGRGGIAGLLLGSVSQGVLHHAHCPVAVVRAGS